MQDVTIRWHVYEMTHSLVALGLIGLCRFIPLVLFSLIGGAIADARDRKSILLITQATLAASAVLLALLTERGTISALGIYAVSAVGAAAMAFDSPARQSFIPNLVPRIHYPNAVSLNSTTFKIATVCGPYVAGLLLQRGNIAIVYWINAASFLAVLVALLCIRVEMRQSVTSQRGSINLSGMRDGLKYVWSQPIQRWTICLDFLASFFASAEALLPAFAKDILRVDARGYGMLTAAAAAGSVGAGSAMAARPPIARQGATMLVAVAIYGLATIVFGLSHNFVLTLAALAVGGASDTVSSVLRQTIRQLGTPDHLRGRMTSINMIFFTGGPQLGNMEAGIVASIAGAPFSVVIGGIGCLLAVAWVAVSAPVLRNFCKWDESLD